MVLVASAVIAARVVPVMVAPLPALMPVALPKAPRLRLDAASALLFTELATAAAEALAVPLITPLAAMSSCEVLMKVTAISGQLLSDKEQGGSHWVFRGVCVVSGPESTPNPKLRISRCR